MTLTFNIGIVAVCSHDRGQFLFCLGYELNVNPAKPGLSSDVHTYCPLCINVKKTNTYEVLNL